MPKLRMLDIERCNKVERVHPPLESREALVTPSRSYVQR
jgi:hypothetical protein